MRKSDFMRACELPIEMVSGIGGASANWLTTTSLGVAATLCYKLGKGKDPKRFAKFAIVAGSIALGEVVGYAVQSKLRDDILRGLAEDVGDLVQLVTDPEGFKRDHMADIAAFQPLDAKGARHGDEADAGEGGRGRGGRPTWKRSHSR